MGILSFRKVPLQEKQLRAIQKRFPRIMESLQICAHPYRGVPAENKYACAMGLARSRIDVAHEIKGFLKAKTSWGKERHIFILEMLGDEAVILAARDALAKEKVRHIEFLLPRMHAIREKGGVLADAVESWWEGVCHWQDRIAFWKAI